MKVVCFGEIMLRLSSPGYRRLFQGDSLDALYSGSEANVAVSLSQLGTPAEFLTVLPDNELGDEAIRSLRYFGVSTDHITRGEGRLGLYFYEKGASQRPSKVIYDRSFSAISLSGPGAFDWDAICSNANWLHFSGITPALSDSCEKLVFEGLQSAKNHGVTVSCDLNYRKKLWPVEKAREVMSRFMDYVDICIANEEDADKSLGITAENTDVESGLLDVEGYQHVARSIVDKFGCRRVAVSLRESHSATRNGWSGLLYDADTARLYRSRKYVIDIVDREGGGDAFTAGLIHGFSSGWGCQKSVDFAVAAGCLKHSIEGNFNLVSEDEVLSLMSGSGNGRVQR
jgi:2-dehydro-3-deoxygluconokinase